MFTFSLPHRLIPVVIAKKDPSGVEALLAQLTPRTAAAVRRALKQGSVDREELERAVQSLDVERIVALFEPIAIEPLAAVLTDAAVAGAARGAAMVPGADALIVADNPLVARVANQQAGDLIRFITDSQRETVRQLIEHGLRSGERIFDMASAIQRTVGLLPNHAVAVERSRQKLLSNGTSLSRAEQLANDYTTRLLRYRAMNIARSETQTALHTGERAAWDISASEGLFNPATAKHKWLISAGACTKICLPMRNQVQPYTRSFVTGTGRLVMHPPSHPSCRCSVLLLLD